MAVGVIVSALIAVGGARHEPTSWSDSSRLATVESLVDRQTFSISGSLFARDIGDKVFIDGEFYSHKPPVPAVLMAGVYGILQVATGLKASETPSSFYRLMTVSSSGIAYVIAVACLFQLTTRLRLPLSSRLLLAASFAGATLAPVYSRAVNDHILGLAVTVALFATLSNRKTTPGALPWTIGQLLVSGMLAGLAYTLDVASGLPLLAAITALIGFRSRSLAQCAVLILGALPWIAVNHVVNYAISGSLTPIAMTPEFFQWPGSPFVDPATLTGAWNHDDIAGFVTYGVGLLIGPVGFMVFNLPVWLAPHGLLRLARRGAPELPELITAAIWALTTWLAYAALSTNYGGESISIRWFVPLLGAAFLVLCVFVREFPEYRYDLLLLSGFGTFWSFRMWQRGPWGYASMNWTFIAVALVSWLIVRVAVSRMGRRHGTIPESG
jgi:hypothetical protein